MGNRGGHDVVISDLGALRAVADPLRRRILELLERPRTVKELAGLLDRPADRLYYHLRQLERHDLVRVLDERASERQFQTARSITIDPSLAVPAATVETLVASVLDRVRDEFAAAGRRTRDDEVKRSMLAMRHVRLTEAEREELSERLGAMAAEFEQREDDPGEERATYGVVAGLWPVVEDE
jgi:DNA-binding transcriptional ArsR family regulator